jgi:hypothetical protein
MCNRVLKSLDNHSAAISSDEDTYKFSSSSCSTDVTKGYIHLGTEQCNLNAKQMKLVIFL